MNTINFTFTQKIVVAFFILLLSLNFNVYAQGIGVSNYKVYLGVGDYNNKKIIVIRQFSRAGKQFYVGINPNDISTSILSSDQIKVSPSNWQQILIGYKNTPYIKAILAAKQQSFDLQNAGIINGYPADKGIVLTIDLCPSHKPLDRIVFTSLINEFNKYEKPVPIALSITGRFMITHSEDIEWLKNLEKTGYINITWVNHTYNHHFNPKVPLKNNFLLEPGTDLNFEILGTEMALLEKDLKLSAFFRFPGLVSDHQLVEDVTNYGLIPIGSDAWLAKGQVAHNGNIVLIHGNGNEPLGIKEFSNLLQKEKSAVMNKQWLLYDLRENVEDEFENSK
ncbi:polysaccharide deacetylase [Kaistella flava (ex Peng et al. 2021)]|uniref:Polysaccharide deacetylase n=1 Tax=Kaistella flava (ex Peng et al. 2021) TaxID=2038776 RepID=A0A7M2Y855_9FLAO|nr:polysaccharide deacetylase [Kaistella flava (ex Peng et al. 2021)]QOW09582.1 polysaccharide deacetylase [Kaistella flava (ex Peng et al. 2021)]